MAVFGFSLLPWSPPRFFLLSHFQPRPPFNSTPKTSPAGRVLSQELTTTTSTSSLATSSFMGLLNPGAAGKSSSGEAR